MTPKIQRGSPVCNGQPIRPPPPPRNFWPGMEDGLLAVCNVFLACGSVSAIIYPLRSFDMTPWLAGDNGWTQDDIIAVTLYQVGRIRNEQLGRISVPTGRHQVTFHLTTHANQRHVECFGRQLLELQLGPIPIPEHLLRPCPCGNVAMVLFVKADHVGQDSAWFTTNHDI